MIRVVDMHFEVIPDPESCGATTSETTAWTIRDNATGFVGVGVLPFTDKRRALREAALREALFGAGAIAAAIPKAFPGESFKVSRENDSYFVEVTWEHDRAYPPVKRAVEDAVKAAGYDLQVGNYFIHRGVQGLRIMPRVTSQDE